MAHGAVATDEEECSRVGASILAGGGSAVDVAVASVVCLMVVHPHTVGPGGSGVMLVHDHKMNTTTIIDFQSAVPSAYNHQNPPPGPTGNPEPPSFHPSMLLLLSTVQEWPSVQMTLRNHTIHTSPAFSGGAQLLAALHLLKHANITTTTPQHHLYHTFIQAIRTSYAYLIHLGLGVEAGLTNRTELETEELDAEFDGETDTPLPRQLPEQAGSPVSVMDTFDQYVATVVGLGTHFGSRYMTRHGILFNNHLSNLRATAGAGYVPSRPVTSYTPVVITDMNRICGPRVVLSSPEVGAAVQVVGQLIFRDRPLIDAIKQRRVTVSADNNLVLVDDLRSDEVAPLPGDVRNYLEAQNNTLRILYPPYAGVNGITKDKDALTSWSDSRGGGVAHRLEPPVKPKPQETQTPPPTPPPEVVTPGEPQMMP
ncbi:Gamma-glutamyltransferase 7 [Portunus trituberculatus]|uniref:Gamma-glutamyltransferase 7 n=1 Tax=Portunus trituberculatus TaxID=210409 RepID=A0A5B7DIQ2_PORTR|nr:Gamma-glutamyltransferase 7 [Portunus trituberculatus]